MTEPSLPDLAGQFNLVAGRLNGKVKVVGKKEKGGVTTVSVRWTKPEGSTTAESIELETVGGESKILSAAFVDQIVKEIQEAEG